MLPSTIDRVPSHTAPHINERIRERTLYRVARALRDGEVGIQRRLAALDREWDVERVLEANAASLIVLSSVLGFTRDSRFFVVPAIVGGFLLQHALQGWCPPLPVLRRLGVRTIDEIEEERRMLRLAARRQTNAEWEDDGGLVLQVS